jgi:outer membrane lipopolysaccharide assembly protein LptE/RlpB
VSIRVFLLLPAVALLTACATYYRNTNPGANFQADSYQCERENSEQVFLALNGVAVADREVNWPMVRACLKARGWYEVDGP